MTSKRVVVCTRGGSEAAHSVGAEEALTLGRRLTGSLRARLCWLVLGPLPEDGVEQARRFGVDDIDQLEDSRLDGFSPDSWVEALPKATRAYNDNSHPHLMGSTPNDVKDSPELQYALEKEAGEDIAHNHAEHVKRLRRLLEQGAFRVVLPRREWTRTGEPRYSERVHTVDHLVGSSVVSTDGARFAVRDVLAVPSGSADVQVPREIRGGNPARQGAQQEALRPFAEALKGFLGDGFLTLQGAGTKLSQVPGFRDAMRAQRMGGNGALQRFLALFPDFVIEGQAPRARVRLTETARQALGEPRRRLSAKTAPGQQ